MIKLVIFDWNGTIIADLEAATVGCNAKLKVYGYPPITSKRYQEAFEIPAINFYRTLGVTEEILKSKSKEASEAFHAAYEPRASQIRTRQGVRELLDFLSNRNVTKILFSNHTMSGINFQLQRLRIASYFDAVLANSDIYSSELQGKKHRLIDYINTSPFISHEIMIVGDTAEEISIGKELGLVTAGVTGGFTTKAKLNLAKPDFLIGKISDLIPVLKKL